MAAYELGAISRNTYILCIGTRCIYYFYKCTFFDEYKPFCYIEESGLFGI